MADDKHYVGGDNYLLDDLSGFKIRRTRTRIIPGGQTGNLAVSPERWEPQQPQDFVRGVTDDQTVDLARPRQQNQFVIVGTYVIAPSVKGSNSITVATPVGFQPNNLIQIMLDSGVNQQIAIKSIAGNVMTLWGSLSASVGLFFGSPIENSVLLLQQSTKGGTFVLDSANNDFLDWNTLG